MRGFSPDQLQALLRYHRYRFYEELGWTTILLFFLVYGLLIYRSFVAPWGAVPLSAAAPIAIGVLVYVVFQLFGAAVLIVRVHDSGVRHTGDIFEGERIGWFTIWSPIAIAFGLIMALTIPGILGWALLFASGIVASSMARLTLLQGRYRFIERRIADAPGNKVHHLADVVKQ